MSEADAAQRDVFYDARLAGASAVIKNEVAKLRQEAQAKNWTFTVGYTSALDVPLAELAGTFLPPNILDIAKKQNEFAARALALLPQQAELAGGCGSQRRFDWRRLGKVPPIRDQGQCGSCWAFASAAAYEASYAIQNNLNVDASEQHILSCSNGGTCKGGYFSKALNFTIQHGVADQTTLPYVAQDKTCQPNLPSPYRSAVWAFVNDKVTLPAVRDIKDAICAHGPVVAAVNATRAFQAYKGGVFNERDPGNINHAIVLVGWDDARGAWLLKNSWGVRWGEAGLHVDRL